MNNVNIDKTEKNPINLNSKIDWGEFIISYSVAQDFILNNEMNLKVKIIKKMFIEFYLRNFWKPKDEFDEGESWWIIWWLIIKKIPLIFIL